MKGRVLMIDVKKLPRAEKASDVGVDSDVVREFLDVLDSKKLNMHSVMVLRHGKVAAECYWAPYKADKPMSMFSFSKGITATAIGIAVGEGLLSLSDKMIDYFPFECKTKRDRERYAKVTVYDVITHRSGKKIPVIYDSQENRWDELWLNAPFKDEPGTKFNYLSENTYMLSKLLTKLTGQTVSEYLTPRLFEPLGIDVPFWEKDHDGCDAGGWGAFMTIEDIAKIGQCYLQHGEWNGRQLIPADWIDQATEPHVTKIPSIFNKNTGYGYQLFVQPERGTYSFNGLYGQFVVVYPEYDAVFACTSGECDENTFIHILNEYFPKAFQSGKMPENDNELSAAVAHRADPYVAKAVRNESRELYLKNKHIKIEGENSYAGIIGPSTTFMLSKRSGCINDICLDFEGDVLKMSFVESDCGEQTIDVGLAGERLYSEIMISGIGFEVASSATWNENGDELTVTIVPLGSAQERILKFTFDGENVKIKAYANPGFYELFNFYLMFNGVKAVPPLKVVTKLFGVYADHMYNPNYKGTIEID